MSSGDLGYEAFKSMRQGDILRIKPGLAGESVGLVNTLTCVALLSQTCDIVQDNKPFCLVAPVQQAQADDPRFVDALKGRRPLHVPL